MREAASPWRFVQLSYDSGHVAVAGMRPMWDRLNLGHKCLYHSSNKLGMMTGLC
jgi:hypothetical protein